MEGLLLVYIQSFISLYFIQSCTVIITTTYYNLLSEIYIQFKCDTLANLKLLMCNAIAINYDYYYFVISGHL